MNQEDQGRCDGILRQKSTEDKLQLLDDFLHQLSRKINHRKGLADAIIQYIHRKRGQIKIQEIADHFQLNYKYLERLFRQQVGLTPKMYCKIIRFNATLLYHQQAGLSRLTDLAYASGYFDQMHFIKEVKQFTGFSPSHFFAHHSEPIARQQTQAIGKRLTFG